MTGAPKSSRIPVPGTIRQSAVRSRARACSHLAHSPDNRPAGPGKRRRGSARIGTQLTPNSASTRSGTEAMTVKRASGKCLRSSASVTSSVASFPVLPIPNRP
jgi:hypothetical protein